MKPNSMLCLANLLGVTYAIRLDHSGQVFASNYAVAPSS
jgi:hypothetical protein